MTRSGEVRFALINGRRQLEPSGPKSANKRHRGHDVTCHFVALSAGAESDRDFFFTVVDAVLTFDAR